MPRPKLRYMFGNRSINVFLFRLGIWTHRNHWVGCGSGSCRIRCDELSSVLYTGQNLTALHDPVSTWTICHFYKDTTHPHTRNFCLRDIFWVSLRGSHPGVQQQVVRFDVSVDEAQLVDGVNGQNCLCDVELGGLFRQSVLLHQQGHHVAWQQWQRSKLLKGKTQHFLFWFMSQSARVKQIMTSYHLNQCKPPGRNSMMR